MDIIKLYLHHIENGVIRPNNAIIFKLQVIKINSKGSFQSFAQYELKRIITIFRCIE
jgi:hypothetical protein